MALTCVRAAACAPCSKPRFKPCFKPRFQWLRELLGMEAEGPSSSERARRMVRGVDGKVLPLLSFNIFASGDMSNGPSPLAVLGI